MRRAGYRKTGGIAAAEAATRELNAAYLTVMAEGQYTDDTLKRLSARYRRSFDRHLQVHRATSDGVPVQGYFQWSMMDNFEWISGYGNPFRLVHVDFDKLERTPKSAPNVSVKRHPATWSSKARRDQPRRRQAHRSVRRRPRQNARSRLTSRSAIRTHPTAGAPLPMTSLQLPSRSARSRAPRRRTNTNGDEQGWLRS